MLFRSDGDRDSLDSSFSDAGGFLHQQDWRYRKGCVFAVLLFLKERSTGPPPIILSDVLFSFLYQIFA